MDAATLLSRIAEAIEHEGLLEPGMALEEIPTWDSLGILNVLDLYEMLGFEVELEKLQDAKTTDDLLLMAGGAGGA